MVEGEADTADWRRRVDGFYRDEIEQFYEEQLQIVDASRNPRGPQLFFDRAAELGLTASSRALDVGSRDARHLAEVEDRFGCPPVGVEPATGNLARMRRRFGPRPFSVVRGVAEALPFPDGTFDFVWVRDVLVHVLPLTAAFAELRRVKVADAPILVFHVCATEELEPREARRLWHRTAAVAANTDRTFFERAIRDAGLRVDDRDDLHGEWHEYRQEQEGAAGARLVRTSRMLRDPEHFRCELGDELYDIELGDNLYAVYQMLGKLSPSIYVLR
jgi:ubiquinone/menaquinone biosynthesis C-methylase UbiE